MGGTKHDKGKLRLELVPGDVVRLWASRCALDGEIELLNALADFAEGDNAAIKRAFEALDERFDDGDIIEQIAAVLGFGAAKYDAWNWAKGFAWSRLIGAAYRHVFAVTRGEREDPESGLPHLAHAACCVAFLITHVERGLGEDDRHRWPVRGERYETAVVDEWRVTRDDDGGVTAEVVPTTDFADHYSYAEPLPDDPAPERCASIMPGGSKAYPTRCFKQSGHGGEHSTGTNSWRP